MAKSGTTKRQLSGSSFGTIYTRTRTGTLPSGRKYTSQMRDVGNSREGTSSRTTSVRGKGSKTTEIKRNYGDNTKKVTRTRPK